MGRQIESFHNFLQACRMPRAVYEEAEDEVCLEVPIIGVTLRAPKVAPDDVNEADWHPKENLCEQAIEMLKEANVWGLRGVRLRMQLKEMGVDVGDGRRRSERCDDLDGPADVLVSWLKDGLYEEAKTEIQLLDERLSEFSQEDLSRMVAQIGLEVSYQLQDSPDDLAQLACGFLLRLLASLDGTGNVRDESVALGLIRIIEAVLLFHIPARPWGKPLVPVFCRVIRYLMERRMSPFMARNRLECIEFFFNAKVHKLLPKASDLHPPDAQKADKQLVKLAEELMLPEARRAQMIQAFEDEICPAAKDAFSGTCRLFGSLVNGFATVDADIDVGIHIPADKWDRYIWRGHWEHWRRRARINRRNAREETNEPVKEQTGGHFAIVFALRDLGAKVEERGYMVERVESARVPILRCDKGDIHVDISLSYEVVYYNSRLLKCYSLLAPQVVHMSLLVKKWAKVREVNDALQGTLSSYSYILLVIGFLQQRKLLPNLQDDDLIDKVAYEEGNTVEDEGKIDLRFFDFEKEGQTAEDARAYFDMAAMPCMHALMAEFFRFYAYEFNFYTQAISIKHTDLLQKIKLFFIHEDDEQNIWRYRKRLWLSILDPFEPNRVLGCTARGQERLCVELRRAMDLMVVGEVSRIFEPWDRRRERDFAYSLQQVIRYDPLYRSNRWLSPLRPLDDGYYEQVDYQRYQEPRYQEKNAPKAIKQEVTEEQILELIGDTKAIALQVVENKLGKIGISRAKKFEHFVLKWDGQEAYLQKLALPKPGKKDPRGHNRSFYAQATLNFKGALMARDDARRGADRDYDRGVYVRAPPHDCYDERQHAPHTTTEEGKTRTEWPKGCGARKSSSTTNESSTKGVQEYHTGYAAPQRRVADEFYCTDNAPRVDDARQFADAHRGATWNDGNDRHQYDVDYDRNRIPRHLRYDQHRSADTAQHDIHGRQHAPHARSDLCALNGESDKTSAGVRGLRHEHDVELDRPLRRFNPAARQEEPISRVPPNVPSSLMTSTVAHMRHEHEHEHVMASAQDKMTPSAAGRYDYVQQESTSDSPSHVALMAYPLAAYPHSSVPTMSHPLAGRNVDRSRCSHVLSQGHHPLSPTNITAMYSGAGMHHDGTAASDTYGNGLTVTERQEEKLRQATKKGRNKCTTVTIVPRETRDEDNASSWYTTATSAGYTASTSTQHVDGRAERDGSRNSGMNEQRARYAPHNTRDARARQRHAVPPSYGDSPHATGLRQRGAMQRGDGRAYRRHKDAEQHMPSGFYLQHNERSEGDNRFDGSQGLTAYRCDVEEYEDRATNGCDQNQYNGLRQGENQRKRQSDNQYNGSRQGENQRRVGENQYYDQRHGDNQQRQGENQNNGLRQGENHRRQSENQYNGSRQGESQRFNAREDEVRFSGDSHYASSARRRQYDSYRGKYSQRTMYSQYNKNRKNGAASARHNAGGNGQHVNSSHNVGDDEQYVHPAHNPPDSCNTPPHAGDAVAGRTLLRMVKPDEQSASVNHVAPPPAPLTQDVITALSSALPSQLFQ